MHYPWISAYLIFWSLQLIESRNGSIETSTLFYHSDIYRKQRRKTSCLGHGLHNWMTLFNLHCWIHSYMIWSIFWKLRKLFYCSNICRIREIIAWVRFSPFPFLLFWLQGEFTENEMLRLKFQETTFSCSQENKLASLFTCFIEKWIISFLASPVERQKL